MSEAERNHVFLSYAHEDQKWCEAFEVMLAPACQRGIIALWDDHRIPVGESWSRAIEDALGRARVGLLLVSPNFLASSYISNVELQRLLDAAAAHAVSIHWVPVSSSLFRYSDLSGIQGCWDPEKPLDALPEPEQKKAIAEICLALVDRFAVAAPVSKDRKDRLSAQVQQQLGGKYVLTKPISSGKLAVLYQAAREQPKQDVAIKVLFASELDDWARKQFIECVERALALRSPAFIRILDCSMETSPEFLVSELVEGERLTDFLRRHPAGLPLPLVRSILLDLATAIAELHQGDWRRGEMCPSDVLIQKSGAARMSAVNFSNVLREQGQLGGTFPVDRESLSYMTPERYYGKPASAATDQYSLGLLATELLSGQPIRRVMHPCDLAFREKFFAGLESGQNVWAKRSAEFTGLVRRMLRIDPEERWPSMDEVAERLRDIDVAESASDLLRRQATSGYMRLLAGSGTRVEREFFAKFYRNLFSADPALEALFEPLDMERQYRALNLAIYRLLEYQPQSARSKQQLEQIAERHSHLGLEPRHYDMFLDAFMKTLVDYETDPQTLEAWRAALGGGIAFMAKAATAKQAS